MALNGEGKSYQNNSVEMEFVGSGFISDRESCGMIATLQIFKSLIDLTSRRFRTFGRFEMFLILHNKNRAGGIMENLIAYTT